MSIMKMFIIIQLTMLSLSLASGLDLLTQVKSSNPKDRLKCLAALEEKFADKSIIDPGDYALINMLIQDDNFRVQSDALLLVYSLSKEELVPFTEAEKFEASIQSIINQERVSTLRESNLGDDEILVLLRSCMAMSDLYMWHPLASYSDYSNWQSGVARVILKYALSNRHKLSDDSDYAMLKVFNGIYEAASVIDLSSMLVESVVIDIDNISTDKVQNSIIFLWSHPLIGVNRPMNPIFKNLLRPHVETIIRKVRGIDNKFQRDEVLRIINEIINMPDNQ